MAASVRMKVLTAEQAQALDSDLLSRPGFSRAQLAELAGLAAAQAIHAVYDPAQYPRVLVVLGRGANGMIGMVTARHLSTYGYYVTAFVRDSATGRQNHPDLVAQLDMMQAVHEPFHTSRNTHITSFAATAIGVGNGIVALECSELRRLG